MCTLTTCKKQIRNENLNTVGLRGWEDERDHENEETAWIHSVSFPHPGGTYIKVCIDRN